MGHDGERRFELDFELGLDERVCPTCRRDLRPWEDDCPDCRAPAVLRMSLPGVMPAVPAHLRDAVDWEPADDAPAVEATSSSSRSDELSGTADDESQPHAWAPEPPPVGGLVFLGGAGGGGCDGGGGC